MKLLPLFFLILCSCSSPDLKVGMIRNGRGQTVLWPKLPVVMYIDESVPKEYIPVIHRAAAVWNIDRERIRIENEQFTSDWGHDKVNVIYWVKDWNFDPNIQAVTSTYWIGRRYVEADIRVNSRNFTFYISNPTDPRAIHIETIFVHEFGHVLGLDHRTSRDSVMIPRLPSNYERNQLTKEDLWVLRNAYESK